VDAVHSVTLPRSRPVDRSPDAPGGAATTAAGAVLDGLIDAGLELAAGIGVTTIPVLALRGHRIKGFSATRLKDADRRVYAVTYGQPPDPPATAALLSALSHAAKIS
jgi:hypothetical protein